MRDSAQSSARFCSARRKDRFVYCCVIAGTCFDVTVPAWRKYATIWYFYSAFILGVLCNGKREGPVCSSVSLRQYFQPLYFLKRFVKFDVGDFHRKLQGNLDFPRCGFISKPTLLHLIILILVAVTDTWGHPGVTFRIKDSIRRHCKASVTAGRGKSQQFLWENTQLLLIPEWKMIQFDSRVTKSHNWTRIMNPTTIHLYFLFLNMSLINSLTFGHGTLDHPLWTSVIQKIHNLFIRFVKIITFGKMFTVKPKFRP
jgi:hypothetical protein